MLTQACGRDYPTAEHLSRLSLTREACRDCGLPESLLSSEKVSRWVGNKSAWVGEAPLDSEEGARRATRRGGDFQ